MTGESRQIEISSAGEKCVLRLRGILGPAEAEALRQAALDACGQATGVVVDWSAAEQIDSSVVQVLLALRTGLSATGRPFATTAAPPGVRTYLQNGGFGDLFDEAAGRQGD